MEIKVEGLEPILKRMAQFPQEAQKVTEKTMEASLLTLWESVPKYPNPPAGSTYTRTGTLGRSLGTSQGGGKGGGQPDIYEVKAMGAGGYEGSFGSRLDYAPYVIGDGTQAHQNSHWWTISAVAERAVSKIEKLWNIAAEEMARWLDKGQ